jgi:16S rRNA (adenine1518-N6/adenine1519-N6)-dimethyltransferase
MKLSEMRDLLLVRGIQLTKSLGQNFLHDGNQLRRIVEMAELTRADKVLEIGPGLGPLTELLIENASEVLAIEKDARLAEVLGERFFVRPASRPSPASRKSEAGATRVLQLVHDDALKFLRRERHDWSDWKLVANLPYSVASPILVELAQTPNRPERMVVTLQIEVARRLMAAPGDRDYGLLTLLVQLDYDPRGWFKIPASCFFPAPEVDSACVVLVRRARPLISGEHRETFRKLVKRAFSQRRKMMLKLLKQEWAEAKLLAAYDSIGLDPHVRAEAVGLEPFVELAGQLSAALSTQDRS